MPTKVYFRDLRRIEYQPAWDYQEQLLSQIVERKLENRRRQKAGEELLPLPQNYLLFCEHPHVYTLGKSGSMDHLLLNEEQLEERGVQFFPINRGGDITYHGPGQIVGYPILDLDQFFTDVHKYVRFLEEAVIRTLAEYGIEAGREEGYTGVWLEGRPKRKICAIGVHLKRWVTMHGFAFNVNTDLAYFGHIIPCGIADKDKEVTSMTRELGRSPDIEEVKRKLKIHLSALFDFELIPAAS